MTTYGEEKETVRGEETSFAGDLIDISKEQGDKSETREFD